jgi:hypothetical protein
VIRDDHARLDAKRVHEQREERLRIRNGAAQFRDET